jgi:voltage-gated potassium channel
MPNSLRVCTFHSQIYRFAFDLSYKRGFSHLVERSIAFLIVASVLAVLLENTPEIYSRYVSLFHWFDFLTIGIFTVEYVLRVFTANLSSEFSAKRYPRLSYAFSFYGLVDLVSIAPFYFSRFVDVDLEMLRALRVLRLVRMFKLSREIVPAWKEFHSLNEGRTFRAKVFAGYSGRP